MKVIPDDRVEGSRTRGAAGAAAGLPPSAVRSRGATEGWWAVSGGGHTPWPPAAAELQAVHEELAEARDQLRHLMLLQPLCAVTTRMHIWIRPQALISVSFDHRLSKSWRELGFD